MRYKRHEGKLLLGLPGKVPLIPRVLHDTVFSPSSGCFMVEGDGQRKGQAGSSVTLPLTQPAPEPPPSCLSAEIMHSHFELWFVLLETEAFLIQIYPERLGNL